MSIIKNNNFFNDCKITGQLLHHLNTLCNWVNEWHFGICRHLGENAASPVSCTQHVFIYQTRSRANEKINSTDKKPLCPQCVTVNPYGHSRVLWRNMSLGGKVPASTKCFCSAPQTKGYCAIISKLHTSRLLQLQMENWLLSRKNNVRED